ncbi:hypothetical protein IU471_35750 [Nocardia elegans]|uniref:hypothetical protein n=1 Tax=Nocardia elegans TaxID=300029 RepID=UPI001895DE8C|nr:hypothetical protein [Nocardia elegans]MBF6248859.1 hypothetical protein [Nocardia elegans]
MKLRKKTELLDVKPRKSTAILVAAWIATFVLYVFVKPDQQVATKISPISGTTPAVVNNNTVPASANTGQAGP